MVVKSRVERILDPIDVKSGKKVDRYFLISTCCLQESSSSLVPDLVCRE